MSIITPLHWRGKEELVTLGAMEWIAHRAANHRCLIAPALEVADGVELDVHLLRGRLEVRHSKALWPMRIYWERDRGILPHERPPRLASILAEIADDSGLWIDLKASSSRLTRRVLRSTERYSRVTMSSRSWWILGHARRTNAVRTFRSVGNRMELWIAVRIEHPDGVGLPERFATPPVVRQLRSRCARIAVWGVRDERRVAELHALGVDVLIVDDLALVATDPDQT